MARGFKRRGKGGGVRYVAKLDELERAVIAGLMEQVRDMLAPTEEPQVTGDDEFDGIVASLGGLGAGVRLTADSPGWPDTGPVPETARSFGERDPALERLLPAGHREDSQAAAEFRRLTEDGLRRTKAGRLEAAIRALRAGPDTVELDQAGALAMVVALTDVRLVLGERLGLREDDDVDRLDALVVELDPGDPIAHAAAVYDFLTWLQESLAHSLLSGPVR